MRSERDALGEKRIPAGALYGIHTARALENFPISGVRLHPALIRALALVKEACAATNQELGLLAPDKAEAIRRACREIAGGGLSEHFPVDAFQGGAGTSANMNVNEVVANRAIQLLGGEPGEYALVHPLHDVNLHQSTNDVFPTALKVAALCELKALEDRVAGLQEALQAKEREFAGVVKPGRTELMDAVPLTLGAAFSAFAEAVARDRWRIFKCRERLKQVNLGGTAVGSGLGAPREYIFRAAENLKALTGLPLSRAENLIDATQNLDPFVEASGMLRAFAANLLKICSDLRLLSSGPDAGLGELRLPALQAGSSIMPGKVNPVLPEAASQVALRVLANDQCLALAAGLGQLELNHLMPLIAHVLLESLTLLSNLTPLLAERCIAGIEADAARCRELAEKSQVLSTALVPALGYAKVEELAAKARAAGKPLTRILVEEGLLDEAAATELLSPRRMRKQGFDPDDFAAFGKKP
jgi:aspartate ammonia-lyase